jgi:16S rRNA (guanine527-N7)-methyltransferase
MSAADQLQQGLQDLGVELSTPAQNKLLAYTALLEKWNRTYRLTAVPNSALTVSHHLLDSLAVLPFRTWREPA